MSSDTAGTSAMLLLVFVGVAFAVLAYRVWASQANEQVETASYAATLSALLLLSPLIWAHYWVWLLPALAAYLRSLPERTGWQGKIVLGCVLLICLPLPFDTDTMGLLIPGNVHSLAAAASLRAGLLLVRIAPVCVLFALATVMIEKTARSKLPPTISTTTAPAPPDATPAGATTNTMPL